MLTASALLVALAVGFAPPEAAPAIEPANAANAANAKPITEAEVNAAQQAWCDGLVKIGQVYADGGDYKKVAGEVIDAAYDYAEGKVFFKPTLASGKDTFRPTRAGALSYFVGGDPAFPNDAGFALKKWVKARYDNNAAENGIQIHGDVAITMGNVYVTDAKGNEVMVDKTFVFRRCKDGKLRLCVHKSALPFDPAK
ncbi:MAG: hypothetical protein K2X82_24870 [Gemmataceae bacterium]|nr:hypothetical protein [Gemmataceae bacterium]